MTRELPAIHPGIYVRENILAPRDMTVTEAAKLIGISRPGVSNFLNGKVSATPDMAARLERAFGVSAMTILELQTAYDVQTGKTAGAAQEARAYVPPFLNVRANELENWFTTTISARSKLAVLLRTLIHSTGHDLRQVDFPGHDDAERPGWDGFIESDSGTPWIPAGISGWEFGVTGKVTTKANGDFAKSVRATNMADLADITFVFVTPRRWPGKQAWVSAMKAKNIWKDVRAYDASDIEQWVEQSLAAQTWFANQTERPSSGVRTLERCWQDWANVTEPHLHPSLFSTAIQVWGGKVGEFVTENRSEPLVITADSVEEALAFLCQALAAPELEKHKDRVLIFDEPGVLPKLAQGATDFIAIAHTRDVERELGPFSAALPAVVVYPRNATNSEPDITLEPLGYKAFDEALEAMGKERDDLVSLASKSGRSPTVLRRQLSTIPAIRTPDWAKDDEKSSNLIPLVMLGAWDVHNEADQLALSLLAGDVPFNTLEQNVQVLAKLNDAPVWSIGGYRGVISKIDALFAIAGTFTKADLDRFLQIARMVLGEDDPALDLPEKDRWAASIRGKKREFSGAVREGIAETLVLLAVHGKNLFGERLGFDGEMAAANLIGELLEPLSTRKLEANNRDLPFYAEAAPDTFLRIIERDLRTDQPETLGLLRPADGNPLDTTCPRTGLLWALESLAWNPDTFPRVVNILGRLSEVEINDNWANTPINSLGAIFRVWMPQTAAKHEARVRAIHMLLDKHPAVGWKICLKQFGDYRNSTGHYSQKPKWRADGYGFGKPFKTWGPINTFVVEMVEIALTRPVYSVEMLCDLIGKLRALGPEFQERVWKILDNWHRCGAKDQDVAKVREKIRITAFTRRGRQKADEVEHPDLSKTAKAFYDALLPMDVIHRHEWLFRESWVQESADELAEEEIDFQARGKQIDKLRREALEEIVDERGLDGAFDLAIKGNAQREIGIYLAQSVLSEDQLSKLILRCLREPSNKSCRDSIAEGALQVMRSDQRKVLCENLRADLTEQEALRLLLLSPYQLVTWELVDLLPEEERAIYWRDVAPQYIFDAANENDESVRRLLNARRPWAAFAAMRLKLEEVRPPLVLKMLSDIAEGGNDKVGEYRLHDYDIQRAFRLLDRNPDAPLAEKARLELAFIKVLARNFRGGENHQIPNLERYVEDNPELFVQSVVWAYKRKERGEDPPHYRVAEQDRVHFATTGFDLLEALEHIPGQDKATEEDQLDTLSEWVATVRKACGEVDRSSIADECLGKLLSSSSTGKDGVWPNEVVRDLIEDLQSEDICRGAHTGLYNARGVHLRDEGGGQERILADKYRKWANALQFTHPFLSSTLLMSMVQTYEREANQWDTEAGIRRRLRH